MAEQQFPLLDAGKSDGEVSWRHLLEFYVLRKSILVAVIGRPIRASALSSERATCFSDHSSDKGAAINNAAPPIIPRIRCFMIGLHDRAHIRTYLKIAEGCRSAISVE